MYVVPLPRSCSTHPHLASMYSLIVSLFIFTANNGFLCQARDNNYPPLVQVFVKSLEASIGMIEMFE